MKGSWLLYLLCGWLVVIAACSSPKELTMTPEFKENNRSSAIDKRLSKDNLVRFLDYRAYKDTLISIRQQDSTLNPGIILAGTSDIKINTEREMLFGNDSGKCIIHYHYLLTYHHTGRSAALSIYNLFSKGSKQINQEPEDKLAHVRATGSMQCAAFENVISFSFEEDRINEVNTCGKLVIGPDTFVLKPINKKSLSVNLLTGVQLEKGSIVYAMLQHFPEDIFARNKLFIYTKAAAAEQLTIAAYFAIISWYL